MTTFFISRHPGAVEWARRQGLAVDCWLPHLDVEQVQAGDTVAGTLPIHLAAQVCDRGARYLHLSLDLPAELRGRELSADQLTLARARLESYAVSPGAPVLAATDALNLAVQADLQ
jgi:CRISPR-associated protein Csx16